MSITKTIKLHRCEVYPAIDKAAETTLNIAWPTFVVIYNDIIDDEDDADLPIINTRSKTLSKYTEDAVTSLEGEDNLVKALCRTAWDL